MASSTVFALGVLGLFPSALASISCTNAPLGSASDAIASIAEENTVAVLSGLCDRPDDADMVADSDGVSTSFDILPVSFKIRTSKDAVSGSEVCRQAFEDIVNECFVVSKVWGGSFVEGGVRYTIAKTLGKKVDDFVQELENEQALRDYDQSMLPSGTIQASGYYTASGIPSYIQTGYYTATEAASYYPIESGYVSNIPGGHYSWSVDSSFLNYPSPTATITASSVEFPDDPSPTATITASSVEFPDDPSPTATITASSFEFPGDGPRPTATVSASSVKIPGDGPRPTATVSASSVKIPGDGPRPTATFPASYVAQN